MIEPSATRTIVVSLISVLLSFVDYLEAVTIVDQYPYEEYVLEHRITYNDAISEAKNIKIYPGPIPGCKECTTVEMTYCKDNSVINDHCCCEGGYNKVFPFVEHTCRLSRQPCTVLAGDCAEYTRLRECCCHAYLASLWKYMANGTSNELFDPSAIVRIITIIWVMLRFLSIG